MFFNLWFETSNVLLWNVGQILWLHHRWCLNEMISFLKLIGQEVPLSWFDFRRFKSSDWSIDQFEAPSDILQYCACNSAFDCALSGAEPLRDLQLTETIQYAYRIVIDYIWSLLPWLFWNTHYSSYFHNTIASSNEHCTYDSFRVSAE